MQASSFIHILAQELRKEIRAELASELASELAAPRAAAPSPVATLKADQTQLWVSIQMGSTFVNKAARANGYAKSAPKNETAQKSKTSGKKESVPTPLMLEAVREAAPIERRGKVQTLEQTIALECFKREGSSLGETFTETELKTQFRKVAFKIHPDRHTTASPEQIKSLSSRFQSLVESAEVLEGCLA